MSKNMGKNNKKRPSDDDDTDDESKKSDESFIAYRISGLVIVAIGVFIILYGYIKIRRKSDMRGAYSHPNDVIFYGALFVIVGIGVYFCLPVIFQT
jgi:uncharacterized membrane protein YidH (DUF202 family)